MSSLLHTCFSPEVVKSWRVVYYIPVHVILIFFLPQDKATVNRKWTGCTKSYKHVVSTTLLHVYCLFECTLWFTKNVAAHLWS